MTLRKPPHCDAEKQKSMDTSCESGARRRALRDGRRLEAPRRAWIQYVFNSERWRVCSHVASGSETRRSASVWSAAHIVAPNIVDVSKVRAETPGTSWAAVTSGACGTPMARNDPVACGAPTACGATKCSLRKTTPAALPGGPRPGPMLGAPQADARDTWPLSPLDLAPQKARQSASYLKLGAWMSREPARTPLETSSAVATCATNAARGVPLADMRQGLLREPRHELTEIRTDAADLLAIPQVSMFDSPVPWEVPTIGPSRAPPCANPALETRDFNGSSSGRNMWQAKAGVAVHGKSRAARPRTPST